jgi:hypothetical protein
MASKRAGLGSGLRVRVRGNLNPKMASTRIGLPMVCKSSDIHLERELTFPQKLPFTELPIPYATWSKVVRKSRCYFPTIIPRSSLSRSVVPSCYALPSRQSHLLWLGLVRVQHTARSRRLLHSAQSSLPTYGAPPQMPQHTC